MDGKRSWRRFESEQDQECPPPRRTRRIDLLREQPRPREGRNAGRVRLTMKGRGEKTRKNATRKKEKKKKKKTTRSSERGKLRVSAPRRQSGPHTLTRGSQTEDTCIRLGTHGTPATSVKVSSTISYLQDCALPLEPETLPDSTVRNF